LTKTKGGDALCWAQAHSQSPESLLREAGRWWRKKKQSCCLIWHWRCRDTGQ